MRTPKLLLLTLASLCFVGAEAADFHLSPKGDDAFGDGSAQKPFATLSKAAAVLGARTPEARREPANILLHAGVYAQCDTTIFGAAQSGTERAPVTLRAVGDGPVRLSGGVAIPASALHEVTDEATLARLPKDRDAKATLFEIRAVDLGLDSLPTLAPRGFGRAWEPTWPELSRDGIPLALASAGKVRVGPVAPASPSTSGPTTAAGEKMRSELSDSDAGLLRKAVAGGATPFLGGRFGRVWADDLIAVESVSDKNVVTFANWHGYGIVPEKSGDGGHVGVFNLAEALRHDGDYAIEPSRRRFLVLLDRAKTGGLSVNLTAKTLVKLDGASHLTLERLAFGDCRGNAVEVKGGEHVTISRCEFTHVGETAVDTDSPKRLLVKDSTFAHIGAVGVRLTGGDRPTLTRADNVVEHCAFTDFGRLYRTYAPGVHLSGVGLTVTNCLFREAPHSAILFAPGNDYLIANNDISRVLTGSNDCGAIYGGRDFACFGVLITGNWIHEVAGSERAGVYLDDQLSGVTVKGNRIDVPGALSVLVGGGRFNTVEDNIIAGKVHLDRRGTTRQGAGYMPGMFAVLDKLPLDKEPWKSRYPQVREGDMKLPHGTVIRNNPKTGEFKNPEVGPRL